LNDPLTQI